MSPIRRAPSSIGGSDGATKDLSWSAFGSETSEPDLQPVFFDRQIGARAAQICDLQRRNAPSRRGRPKATGYGEGMANGYSRLKRVRSGVRYGSGNEEWPVLANLHFHEGLQDQLLLLKGELNGLGKRNRGEATCWNLAQQGKRYRARIVDDDFQRIGWLAEHGHAKDIASVKSVPIRVSNIGGEQNKDDGETTTHCAHATGRILKPDEQPSAPLLPSATAWTENVDLNSSSSFALRLPACLVVSCSSEGVVLNAGVQVHKTGSPDPALGRAGGRSAVTANAS